MTAKKLKYGDAIGIGSGIRENENPGRQILFIVLVLRTVGNEQN
jgi:hypothetical protein